jgi:OOP family OmpA-OmpF porin
MKVCAFADIRFDFDKASIRPESEQYLDMFVMILQKFPKMRISIIGHTDNVGNAEYNLQLSKARAESVAAYFKKHGIDASRLTCEGHGHRQPLVDEDTDAARAMNRRVEFDITAY